MNLTSCCLQREIHQHAHPSRSMGPCPAFLSWKSLFGGGKGTNKTRMVTVSKAASSRKTQLPALKIFSLMSVCSLHKSRIKLLSSRPTRDPKPTLSSCFRQHQDSQGIWAEGPTAMHNTETTQHCLSAALLPSDCILRIKSQPQRKDLLLFSGIFLCLEPAW